MVLSAVSVVCCNQLLWRHSSISHSFFIISPPFVLWKGEKITCFWKPAIIHTYKQIHIIFPAFHDGTSWWPSETKTAAGCKATAKKKENCKNLTIPFKMEIIFHWISHLPQHLQNTFSAELTVRSNNNNNSFQL